jgi:hypothetical protein
MDRLLWKPQGTCTHGKLALQIICTAIKLTMEEKYMGHRTTPNQDPATIDFFKIHETTYDSKNDVWGNDILMKNNMTWKVQIPSDIKAGDYIIRHELMALHYAELDNRAEFYVSCLNAKVLGDGTAEPEGVRFPGAYKATDPGLKINTYHSECIRKWKHANPFNILRLTLCYSVLSRTKSLRGKV